MRARVLIAFALGAVLGGAVVWLVPAPRLPAFPGFQTGPETVRVLVAKQELNYGTQLKPGHLRWVDWPKAAVPAGSFTSAEALFGEKGDGKRIVLRSIEPGEPILQSKITKPGESPREAMNLGEGRRAVALTVSVQGVSGFVAPGDRVDIMLTREIEGELISSIIMENVGVIDVDRRANTEGTTPRRSLTVTVGVDGAEAQKLALAQQIGRLSLTLRRPGDARPHVLPPVFRELCPRPWSNYRAIPPNILIPDLCESSFNGAAGPSVRVRRGDFGAPRGLCERPPGAPPPASAWCADSPSLPNNP